ncbi:hypothetical protein [Prosthecomicrobium sp. N25]|uniref:hypothetical protein n=1 Tax=Prosthecomicrobium sp. N25 TaxID=3129254 RepID=UPI0030777CA7
MPRPPLRLAAVALALAATGCRVAEEPTGFVEVKRQFAQSNGTYRLNGEAVAGLADAAGATAVIRQKSGPVTVAFERDTRTYDLCRFDLGKNRIVTVTIYLEGREIKCAVQL